MARHLFQVDIKPGDYAILMQNPQDPGEAVRPVFETVGGSPEEYYFAVGENTVYVLCEFPDLSNLEVITKQVVLTR